MLRTAIDTISQKTREAGGLKRESIGGCESDGHESCLETIKLTGPGLFSDAVYQHLREYQVDPTETVR